MAGADWSLPTTGSNYTDVLAYLKSRDEDAATLFATVATNIATSSIRYVRASNKFQEWDGAVWNDKVLAIAGGGTGGATTSAARTALGLGSIATQDNNAVSITGGSISGVTMSASVITSGTLALNRGGTGASLSLGAAGKVLRVNDAASAVDFLDVLWANITKTGSSLADLATRSASDLSSGTLPDARFPSTLPAISGVNLTAVNAAHVNVQEDTTTNSTFNITWVNANSGNLTIQTSSTKLTFNPSTGNLTATLFTGNLTGNVTGTASVATRVTVQEDTSTNSNFNITWVNANSGNVIVQTSSTKLYFNPSTGLLTATGFSGNLNASNLVAGTLSSSRVAAFNGYSANIVAAGPIAYVGNDPIIFDTEIYDTYGDFNLGTSTFTAPVTGKYLFTACVKIRNVAGGARVLNLLLVTSNRTYYSPASSSIAVGNEYTFQLDVIADMDIADTAYVAINSVGGDASIMGDASNMVTYFIGRLMP